jgi:hypothetical protein
LCAWSAVPFALLYLIGFCGLARMLVPPYPAQAAEAVARNYEEHANGIRLGLILSLFAMMFYLPFMSGVAVHLKRIEGRYTPFTFVQLGASISNAVVFLPVMYFYLAAAYRPDRSPEMVQLLQDLGWLPMTGCIVTIDMQNLAIALAVLGDRNPNPIFPRWYGYLSLWCIALFTPACLDVFFQHGPFAWNGIFTWWMSLVSFFIWIVITAVMQLRAVNKMEDEEFMVPEKMVTA